MTVTASAAHASSRMGARPRRDGWLTAIAVFKAVKSLALIALGLGAFRLLHPGTAHAVREWLFTIALRPGLHAVQHLVGTLTRLDAAKVEALGLGAIAYGVLFGVEGVGLWFGKRWAEWLTVFATGSFLPFEIYELVRERTPLRVATLVVNLAVVVYLIVRLWRGRGREGAAPRGSKETEALSPARARP